MPGKSGIEAELGAHCVRALAECSGDAKEALTKLAAIISSDTKLAAKVIREKATALIQRQQKEDEEFQKLVAAKGMAIKGNWSSGGGRVPGMAHVWLQDATDENLRTGAKYRTHL
jgi:hypothetical protein